MKSRWLLMTTLCLLGALSTAAFAQFTPKQDSYIDTSKPTTNFGNATTLDVANTTTAIQISFIQFDLSAIPAGFTASNVAKATLKLYVNTVTTAGSFNVNFVAGSWAERTITANLSPALGSTIVSSVPVATSNRSGFLDIDVTSALQAWLNGTQVNDGIALVGNSPMSATFDSNENTAQSHSPELDVVFNGAIDGINTSSGSGLTGGGSSGTLNLSLLTSCSSNQILQWNGGSWACSNAGTGTITGVTAGTDLTGGGSGGNVTLNLDTTKVPLLSTANTFTNNQTITGGLTVNGGFFGNAGNFNGNLSTNGSFSGGTAFFTGNNSGTIVQATQNSNGNAIAALSKGGAAINAVGTTAGIVASTLVAGAPAGVFGGAVQIGSPILGGYQTEVSGPNQFILALDSPFAGIGPGVDFNYSDTKARAWEIVATGNGAGQGAGRLLFDDVPHSNASLLVLDSNTDNVGINNLAPIERLDVAGRIRSHNLAAVASFSSAVDASGGDCLGALLSANSACDTPGLSLKETTGNVPVFIIANLGGVGLDGCVVANFALVMDGNIIAANNITPKPSTTTGAFITSVTLVSLQFPPSGSHTFEVQESDDTAVCNGSTQRTGVGFPSNTSSNFSTRTLIVREF